MKFEILIALTLGAILGIGGMVGVVVLSKNVRQAKTPTPVVITPTPTSTEITYSIVTPLTKSSHSSRDLQIDGTTPKDNPILVATMDTDYWILPKENKFSAKVGLIPGINQILVTDTQDLKSIPLEILSADSITDGESYIEGVVTDITAEYIQVRETDGTITQVSINSSTKALTIVKEIKSIKVNEVAIGDFIFAVLSSSDKKLSTFIVVYNSQGEVTAPKIYKGTLEDFDKATITIKNNDKNQALSYSSKTKFVGVNEDNTTRKRTKFIKDDLGSEIFAVQTSTDSATVRSIFIGEKKK